MTQDHSSPAPYSGAPATAVPARRQVRTRHFLQAKQEGRKLIGLTSYDVITASIFDQAGVDFLLVGDSAANTVYGYQSTLPISVDELLPLTAAVARGARSAMVVADLPFGSYESSPQLALATATRFMKETNAQAVKLEGGVRVAEHIAAITQAGIPVMAHIGLTPQSEHGIGGFLIQGRGDQGLNALVRDAEAVAAAGAFAVVLEMVPSAAAREVTAKVPIPTISVGAGPDCDGQLLVWTDWAGLNPGRVPKFVKQYLNLGEQLRDAVAQWREDVASGAFPTEQHSYEG